MSRHAPHAFELRGGAYRWLWALLPGARMYGAFQLDGRDLVAHATVRRVLEHFRLSPELHRVYIMGHVLPQGSNPTRLLVDVANETDLWEFVHEKASNLFLLVERVAGESPDDSECKCHMAASTCFLLGVVIRSSPTLCRILASWHQYCRRVRSVDFQT